MTYRQVLERQRRAAQNIEKRKRAYKEKSRKQSGLVETLMNRKVSIALKKGFFCDAKLLFNNDNLISSDAGDKSFLFTDSRCICELEISKSEFIKALFAKVKENCMDCLF